MSRILVTGAGGFVCRHIVDVLHAAGHQIIALDRVFDESLKARWAMHHLIEGDSAALPALPVDAVVHGAAVTASPEDRHESPEANLRANIEPLLQVSEWAARQGVRRAFFLSSSGVYDQTPAGTVSEDQAPSPLGTYAVAKTLMESLMHTLHTIYQRDVVVLRLSFIYGLDEHPSPTRPRISLVGRMLHEALTSGAITVSDQDYARDWTFANDIGRVIHHLLGRDRLPHSLYNVAAQQVMTSLEIAQSIQSLLPDTTLNITHQPDTLTRLGVLSHQRLAADTGFSAWTPFIDGLRQCIKAGVPA